MTSFQDFLQQRLAAGGFTTEDALASFLPLARLTATAHRNGMVAPLDGLDALKVDGVAIGFDQTLVRPPQLQPDKIRELDQSDRRAMQVVGEIRLTTDVDQGESNLTSLQIGKRGEPITRLVYLPGYLSWEQEIGHHDPISDVFSLGMILASLSCGLDFTNPDDVALFVQHRRNLFDLNPNLHPVLAKAVTRMTELSRQRRPQDLAALVHALENYRDQDIDFDFDLARLPEWKSADRPGKRELILTRLQQRLFDISRRNRLLHFRPTMHTVNLTWASVPLSFDVNSIRPEQLLTWNPDFQKAVASGKPVSLNKFLRFEEAVYLPSLLDGIRNEARRDQTEYGFAPLRLVLCFLRWANLKEKPPQRYDSPLVLLPVQLTKTKGVRDIYSLEATGTDAEVNPILRHYLKQLYGVELPELVDLTTTALDTLHDFLVGKIQSSEPAVTIDKIDRPRIQLIHARAQRRLDQYRKRVRLSGRGVRSFQDLDYSYNRDNYHPLGLRLFQTRIRAPEPRLRSLIEETPRPREYMLASPAAPIEEKEKLLYSQTEEETNPYRWEFDLCSVTLGNFRYQKMSLVRDYDGLLNGNGKARTGSGANFAHAGFDAIFSLEPRPAQPPRLDPLPPEDSYPIVAWDPTQASAIALARTGRNFIIQGPPGTGKSQTITNLIADHVMHGQRVLFVCEKRAAIDVVYHRLQQTGLHVLSCLIHDSQADKKEFIQDLKQTYESFLEAQQGKVTAAEENRQKLLASLKQELTPLQRFQQAMRSIPPQVQVGLRRLLGRAIELRDHHPEMSPLERERVPLYASWQENRERLGRLGGLLEEMQGHTILSQHPLKWLHGQVVKQERPLDYVGQKLRTVEKLLQTLLAQLEALDLPIQEKDTPEKVSHLLRYATHVQFLAERNQLSLLKANSDLAKQFARLNREHQGKAKELVKAREATKAWRHKLPAEELAIALEQARVLEKSFWRFLKPAWWRLRGVIYRCYHFRAHAIPPTITQVLEALQKEYTLQAQLAELEGQARDLFHFAGDYASFAEQVALIGEHLAELPASVQTLHRRLLETAGGDELVVQLGPVTPTFEQLATELTGFLDGCRDFPFHQLRDELVRIEQSLGDLPDFIPCLAELSALPRPLTEVWRNLPLGLAELEAAMAERSLEEIFRSDRALARLTGQVLERHAGKLEHAHDHLHAVNAGVVRESVRRRFLENVRIASLPHAQLTEEQKEFKTQYNRGRKELEHEFGKTMRFKSIRDLVAGNSGIVLKDLKPVWLMSPLSVSDTLPLETNLFDVVIFDEASQVTLEEAVPPLFRAKQIIVVGDEMQLPPTSFFASRQADDGDALVIEEDNGPGIEYDLGSNSFLNHAGRNLPSTLLGWHYRSRSESLISFSNAAFYQNRLLTVPEVTVPRPNLGEIRVGQPDEGLNNVDHLLDRPVSFHFFDKSLYEQRRNPGEAEYIAHLVQGLFTRATSLSIGIIAFSEAQQDEIQDALERLAQKDAAFADRLEAEFEREKDGQFAGLLVKNLENIQGDERDVVILSVCYGYGPSGKMLMNFGPINQSGGEKRLNVAFSRAKQHMVLVSSIRQHDITNDYNAGARCLKNYLRYAEAMSTGQLATARRVLGEMAPQDGTREPEQAADAVIVELTAALRERGFQIDPAVGQSTFRCDLAIRKAGDAAYRLAILVDTDAYYRQTDIIERDVLKPKLLRAFGWTVAVVRAKDWYEDRQGVLNGLEKSLG